MIYALIKDGELVSFPYGADHLRRDNPRTSFPATMSDNYLAAKGVVRVYQEEAPEVGAGEIAILQTVPALVSGKWVQGWTVRSKTPEELETERSKMATPRGTFALAAFSAGIITDVEAEAWAGGTALPGAVTDAFAAAIPDAAERLEARIQALTAAEVHRVNPLILMLQGTLSLTDEQTDALFS